MTTCNNSIHTNNVAWDLLEEKIASFMEEGITFLEGALGYRFKKPEYALLAFLSKRAVTEYTIRPIRTYL